MPFFIQKPGTKLLHGLRSIKSSQANDFQAFAHMWTPKTKEAMQFTRREDAELYDGAHLTKPLASDKYEIVELEDAA